jgi:tetratricopeptide (TPR) repeat protein
MRKRVTVALALLLLAGGAQADEEVEEAVALFRAGRSTEASPQLYALAQAPELSPADRSRARYYLARALHALGLIQAAQLELLALVEQGPQDPYQRYALSGLLDIARQTGDPGPLLTVVDRVDLAAQPSRARPSVSYLQGLGAWQRGELARASGLLAQVPADSDLYPRARYLQGLIMTRQGKQKAAVAAFRDVVAATPQRGDRREREQLDQLRALATLRIARIYDALGDADQAERFYAQVERDSAAWPEALEAMARIDLAQGDPGSALRRSAAASWPVVASSAPRSTAVPRVAEILHAQALYALCRPEEARAVLRFLEGRALPLWTELALATAAQRESEGAWRDPAAAWVAWFEVPATGSTLTSEVFEVLLERGDLAEAVQRQRRIGDELTLLASQDAGWRAAVEGPLRQQLEGALARDRAEAGVVLLEAMADLEAELGVLLALAEDQRGHLAGPDGCPEQAGTALGDDPDAWGGEHRASDGTELSWPFTGEIWADEL